MDVIYPRNLPLKFGQNRVSDLLNFVVVVVHAVVLMLFIPETYL